MSCASQTDISTTLIGLNFETVVAEDDLRTKIQKLHGQIVHHAFQKTRIDRHLARLRQYCEDLNLGKPTKVFKSDLSDELQEILLHCDQSQKNQEVQTERKCYADIDLSEIQHIHGEIFTHLAEKVTQSLHCEIAASLKTLKEFSK